MPITHLRKLDETPGGTTPGPWDVVPDPWDRSGTIIVGSNGGRGPRGDPHVSPSVATTEALGGCHECEEGEHDPETHRADARLIAAAPELYGLVVARLRDIAAIADRDGHNMDGWMSSEGIWARKAVHVLAEILPQRMHHTERGYVYPRSLPVRDIIALLDGHGDEE